MGAIVSSGQQTINGTVTTSLITAIPTGAVLVQKLLKGVATTTALYTVTAGKSLHVFMVWFGGANVAGGNMSIYDGTKDIAVGSVGAAGGGVTLNSYPLELAIVAGGTNLTLVHNNGGNGGSCMLVGYEI